VQYRGGVRLIRKAAEKLKALLRTKAQQRRFEAKQTAEDNAILDMEFGARSTLEAVDYDPTGRAQVRRGLRERILTKSIIGEKVTRFKGLSIAEAEEEARGGKKDGGLIVAEEKAEAAPGLWKSVESVEELPDEHGFVRVPVKGGGPSSSNKTQTTRHSNKVEKGKIVEQDEEQKQVLVP
jgi:hypothetical protein